MPKERHLEQGASPDSIDIEADSLSQPFHVAYAAALTGREGSWHLQG